MNGKKRKNKKLVLDSGGTRHFLRSDLGIKLFKYERISDFKNLILIISHLLEIN